MITCSNYCLTQNLLLPNLRFSYFTHKVTLPFLHFVEVSSQENLLQVFPELYKDLSSGKMNTLDAYVVHYPHNKVLKPTSDLCLKILNKMCLHAAQVFDRQTGREYGFGNFRLSNPSRATELHLLTNEELAGLPTNNLECERHLAGFGKRAAVAKFRNKRFTAKGIRNDCTLLISDAFETKNEKKFNKVVKFLNEMELKWVAEQKKLKLKQIKEKIEKGKKRDQYVQKRLKLCKSWGGPVVSVEELHTILNSHPDQNEVIVRNELIYFRESHKSEVLCNPELFKVNGNTHEERLLNLCALIAEDEECSQSLCSLPTNADAALVVGASSFNMQKEKNADIEVGHFYATLIKEGLLDTWYIATCEGRNGDGTYKMDHLMRVQDGSNLKWKRPTKPDLLNLHSESILDCEIDGEWNVSNERSITFSLRNHNHIELLVKQMSFKES